MTRVKVKGTGIRARSNPDAEPDFWRMSWLGPKAPPSLEEEHDGGTEDEGTAFAFGNGQAEEVVSTAVTRDDESTVAMEETFSDESIHQPNTWTLRTAPALSESVRGSSSVVSYEDCENTVHDNSCDSVHEDSRTTFEHIIPYSPVKKEADNILHGWGMPFHYLDTSDLVNIVSSLPEAKAAPVEGQPVESVDLESALNDLFGSNNDLLSL